ncbi:MAG: hypothetical protein JSW08_00510 [archaeon]|nr:MAG: hypothetical protein JSW08_00510 [archaeon]
MKKRSKFVLIAVMICLSILFIASADAKILFTRPGATYNLGDEVKQTVAITTNENLEGFLRVILNCETFEDLIYYSPVVLKENSEKRVDLNFEATKLGNCKFIAGLELGSEVVESSISDNILITDELDFDLDLNKKHFMPGDELRIRGKIYKKNNELFTGAVIVRIFGGNVSVPVSKGTFNYVAQVPTDTEPGNTTVILEASDDLGNQGVFSLYFTIASVSSQLIIDVPEIIEPGSILEITPKLVDQHGNIVPENVSLRLFQKQSKLFILSENVLLLEEFLTSGESVSYTFDILSAAGDYKIEAYSAGFRTEKIVQLPVVEKIDVKIEEDMLVITNLGNVPYKKPLKLELDFDGLLKPLIIDLDLAIGETQEFKLEAPKGTYGIEIDFEGAKQKFQDITLTGDVVAAIQLGDGGSETGTGYLWIIIIVVILCLIYLFRKRIFKKSHKVAKVKEIKPSKPEERPKQAQVSKTQPQPKVQPKVVSVYRDIGKVQESPLNKVFSGISAEKLGVSSIVTAKLLGIGKHEATVAYIKVHGLSNLENLKKRDTIIFDRLSKELFENIVNTVKGFGGFADLHGRKIVLLFTKPGQELYAVKAVNEVRHFIERFDEKLKQDGLEFALDTSSGIHSGLLSFTSQSNTIKFARDDTMNVAEGLAGKAFKGEILLSAQMHQKVANMIKAKRITPLYLDQNRAIETFLLKQQAPSQIKEEGKSRVRRILDKY